MIKCVLNLVLLTHRVDKNRIKITVYYEVACSDMPTKKLIIGKFTFSNMILTTLYCSHC